MRNRRGLPVLPGLLAVLSVALFFPPLARALTDEEIFRDFRFNFVNPGARALGMGGASASAAEDATAAQADPAGLRYVAAPEFFAEYRSVRNDTNVSQSSLGSLAVDANTGARDLPFLGLTSVSNPDTSQGLGFVSFVYPFHAGGTDRRVAIAGSRQVVLSQDQTLADGSTTTDARFSFDSYPNTVNGTTVEAYSVHTPVSGDSSTEIVYWNLSGAVDLNKDFSLGLTLTYATLDLQADTLTEVNDPLQLFVDPTHPRRPTQPSLDFYRTRIDEGDSDVTFTFGIHVHPDSAFASGVSPWRFAAVYRKGASFSVKEETFLNDLPDQTFENRIIVPDRYSIAASYTAPRNWLFSLELERVEYSDMVKGFQSGVNFLTSGRVAGGSFGVDPNTAVEYTVDDGFIPRVGLEYAPRAGAEGRRLALWAGYFRTPDDRIRMTQFNSTDPKVNEVYLETFGGGEAASHVTGGVGYTVGRSSFQVAGETSDRGSQLVGAFTFRLH